MGSMPDDDQQMAAALTAHRSTLAAAGAAGLGRQPWQADGQPPSDGELVRLAAWRAADPGVDREVITAGLGLLESARAELDQIEAALLFAARAGGMTYQQIGAALGLGSGQAAQQRMSRLHHRLGSA